MTQKQKIGFIGLGIMGAPMALNLVKNGHTLFVNNRSEVPNELITAGALSLATAQEVAQHADIIFIMVPDTPDVKEVLFGETGVAKGLTKGKLVIDMSSISPIATKEFAQKITEFGADYIDAPVSGGEVGAKAGTLSIMIGASVAAFERAKPLFEILGKNITHVGGNGAGQTAKVANQIIVALNIQAVSEALVFAAKAGADPIKVREALLGGFASSKILEVHAERMIKRTFTPGFRIELHQKDIQLALTAAKDLNIALPNTAIVQQLLNSCEAVGDKNLDHSALVKATERLANFELSEKK